MDVLAHLILHFDEDDDTHWIDEQNKDYFNFQSGVDFIEIL